MEVFGNGGSNQTGTENDDFLFHMNVVELANIGYSNPAIELVNG
jgi:hypothetical protein